jgi:hypothetical protein
VARIDRAVQRAREHLAPDEPLIASTLGVEADGRRRSVVLVTPRRVLVCPVRGGEPDSFPLDDSEGSFDRVGDLLTLEHAGTEVVLRDVDETAARQALELLELRRSHGDIGGVRRTGPKVRIVAG